MSDKLGPNDPTKNSMADPPAFQKVQPQCLTCEHWTVDSNPAVCTAFPDGIPMQIWVNNHDHALPFPGDHGIRYQRRKK